MRTLIKTGRMLLILMTLGAFCSPWAAAALTPSQEEELAREFLQVAARHFQFIDDPLIEDYVDQVGQKLVAVLPTQPFSYQFHVLKADVYNAFAIPAGHIFINSGLLAAMETEDELAGILGHEIAHGVSRHISDKLERSKRITAATVAGVIAGVFLGAGGSPEAAQAITSGALAASQSLSLAYSRDDERQADQLGLHYLDKAGYSARGLLAVLDKIRSKQWYDSGDFPDYLSTHPGTEDRIATIDGWIVQHAGRPGAGTPKKTYGFTRAHTRLVAVHGDEAAAFRRFAAAVDRDPNDPMARYGYGLILARKGDLTAAAGQLRKALEKKAFDPYILNDLGRVYLLAGRYADAIGTLQGALSVDPENAETLFLIGRTQLEMGQLNASAKSLETLVAMRPDYPEASYFLGQAQGRIGRMDRAHYHLGMYYRQKGSVKNALFHLRKALPLTEDRRMKDQIEKALAEMKKEEKKVDAEKH